MSHNLKLVTTYLANHWLSVLLLSLAVTAILSTLLSIGQNVWFDEGYSIFVAKMPIGRLIELVGVDAHPPLYYVVLKLWGSIFNWNEFALRFLSIIFATTSVGLVFFIIKKLSGVKIALGVLPFLILAPFALRYSYEIRPYAMASVLLTASTLLLYYASVTKKRLFWVLYAISVTLSMLTLYMSALVLVSHVVWLIYLNIRKPKQATPVKTWLSSYALSIILFLPWLPTFIQQYFNSALPGIGQTLSLGVSADSLSTVLAYETAWGISPILSLFIIALIVGLIILSVNLWNSNTKSLRNNLVFIACLTIVPLVVLFVLNTVTSSPFYITRYLAHFVIFYYMAIGFIVVSSIQYKPKLAWLAGVLSFIILGVGVANLAIKGNFVFERNQKPAIVSALSAIECTPDTTFVTQDEYTYLDSWFYLQGCNFKFLKDSDVSTRGGYAPLHASAAQIRSIDEVSTPNLIFITWDGKDNQSFFKDSQFQLQETRLNNRHKIEIYRQTIVE